MHNGRENGDRCVETRQKIGNGNAHFHWFGAGRPVGLAGDAHQSGHALNEIIVAGLVLIGAGVTEARQRAIDQRGVFRRQAFVIETVFGEASGLEILHHHMGAPRQPFHQCRAFGIGEIDGDGFLVAVGGKEIGGVGFRAVCVFQEGRAEMARLVAFAGLFDLDDLRTQIAQYLRGPWTGEHAAQIEHADMR